MQQYLVKNAGEALRKVADLCVALKMDPLPPYNMSALGKESFAYYDPGSGMVVSNDFATPLNDADKLKIEALISYTP